MQVHGQSATLSGKVTDQNGLPIIGANVILTELSQGAATDLEGLYSISQITPGSYNLAVSAIGYRRTELPVTLSAGALLVQDVVLNEIILESSGVTVTASRREQLTSTTPVSLTVMTPRELESRNVFSLDDALRHVSGVQVKGNQISIRGSTGFSYNVGSRVQLLLDGIPLLTPDSDGIPFEALPFAQVDRIEVLKGPGSALYGSGALGGVVNVITKDFPDQPETTVRTFAGAYEPVRYQTWLEDWDEADQFRPFYGGSVTHAQQVNEKFGFWANMHYRDDVGYLRLNNATSLLGFTKVGWRPRAGLRLDVLASWLWRKKYDYLFWNAAWDALNPGILPNGNPAASDNVSSQIGLVPTLTQVLNSKLYYTLKVRLFGVQSRPLDDITFKPRSAKTDGTYGIRYGAEYQLNWNPLRDRYLTAGLTFDSNWARSSFFGEDGGASSAFLQPQGAAFAQWEQPLIGNLNLVAGARFDLYSISEVETITRVSPKINLFYVFNDRLTARAGYGHGFRTPSLAERFANDEDFGITSNPDIRPEESISYEAGLRSLIPLNAANEIQLDIAAFFNEYVNLIESGVNADRGSLWFSNVPDARIQGIEATIDAALLSGKIQARVGYTLLDTETDRLNEQTGILEKAPLEFRPRHQFNASLDVQVWKGLEAGFDYRNVSTPERYNEDFGVLVTSIEVLTQTNVLDTRLAWNTSRFRAAIIARNALEYYYLERPALLAPPRHFLLQLQAKF